MGTDIWPKAEVWNTEKDIWQPASVTIPDDRNYWTFAVLANVRNGYGFAGCDLGDPVVPIAEPRGLPADLSFASETNFGDHSFSWVTLEELLAVDLDQLITLRGYVDPDTYLKFKNHRILSESWCGGTSMQDYKQIEWQVPLRTAAWLLPKIIATLQPLGEPQNVRLVFGFDS